MNWKLTLLLLAIFAMPNLSYSQICDNVTEGGEIGYDQTLCAPGDDPAPIVNVSLPSGGSGDLEYIWISTTNDPSMVTTVWDIIVGSTSESYDPGPLTETTYFRRCARRAGCTQYIGETNIIRICVDVEAPQFTSTLVDGEIDCTETPQFDTPTYSDDCDLLVGYSFDDETIQNGCTTEYIRTFTIIDDCGKTSTTTQTFTTTDNEAPVISLNAPNQDINDGDILTVECDNLMLFFASDASATDNCDDAPTLTFSDSVENTDCLVTGYLQQWTCSWIAKDACGNTSTFTVFINVVDTTDPVFIDIPADETVDCDGMPVFGTPIFEDNCDDDLMIETMDDSMVDGCTTVFTKTWTITDDCGNSATASQSIIATDNEAPVITLNAPNEDIMDGDTLTMECGMVNLFLIGDATVTDNCDANPTVNFSDSSQDGDCPTDGYLSIWTCSWTATDACGNSSTFTVYATIVDTTDPFFTFVPDDMEIDCADTPVFGLPNYEDICDNALSIEAEETSSVDGCTTTYTKTWTITDDCGNTATASQNITTTDDEAPVISLNAPNDGIMNGDTLIVECDNLNIFFSSDASATDNCDAEPTITFSDSIENGDCLVDGYLQFWTCTWTAKDDCGNTSTFTVYMRVVDTTPPVFTFVPESEMIECLDAPDFGIPTYEDNCDAELDLEMVTDTVTNGCTITYTITWKITDDCGNIAVATQTVTAIDNTAPTLALGSLMDGDTITAECDAIPVFDESSISVSDNCDPFPVTTFDMGVEFGDCPTDGYLRIMSRSWTGVDQCGNTSSLTIYIRVIDTTAPTIALTDNFSDVMNGDTLVAECDDVPAFFSSSVDVTDNCDNDVTVTFVDDITNGDCVDDGFIRFYECTWTAEDDCGNAATFTIYIKVVDTTDPIFINVPDDETIQCDETPIFGIPTFSDNCDADLTETITQDTFYSDCSTEFVRTWTITDDCGNSASASQFIWSIDNTAPTISLNSPYANVMDGDTLIAECDALPFFDATSANLSDNCDAEPTITFAATTAPGDCPTDGHLYVAALVWEATDACGNMSSYTIYIRVVDTTAPTFVSVPDITVESCDDPLIIDGLAVATDNCTSMVGVTFVVDTIITFEDIKYQINWTAKDDCQNSADTLQVITVPCDAEFLFTNITGELMGNTVMIEWTGLNEYPSGIYILERSKDGVDFNFVNSPISAEGVIRNFVDYAGWDAQPYEGHNYYRVQYVDERGRLTYSDVVRIDLPTTTTVKVFPNPSHDYVMVELNDFAETAVTVQLHTRDGIVLETHNLADGQSSIRIETGDLHSGMYFITVQGENTRKQARRFIKAD